MSAERRNQGDRRGAASANLGIAVTKFVACVLTGSSSMLAESIHSVADSGNQALLLLGGKRAQREATPQHPFGYGRERYIYAFIVADRAVQRRWPVRALRGLPQAPAPASRSRAGSGCRSPCWSSRSGWRRFSFRTAIEESNQVRGKPSWVELRPPRQGPGAAGRAARGPRRAARPGLRAVRRRADPDHRRRHLGRHRHRGDRHAAGGHRDHPGDRDQEPAARRGRHARGRAPRSRRPSWPATASSGSST